jgi:aspartyl-tRNA(Asn)/glutamyl-tRNA(Gln) amidotransferase subunit B
MEWETVIGLEVHAQLTTNSKLFSASSTKFGAIANTQTSLIDAAIPGVLPVVNKKAIELAIRFGVAIGAQINNHSLFERKNYFYPDLPKGYQISQFQKPIVGKGVLTIDLSNGQTKSIGITRAHLEEDAGKSLHEDYHGCSGIDLNRAGTPLLEIVSEPDIRSAEEAISYLKNLHQLVRFLRICDGNMQEGSFRVDVNISIREQGVTTLGTRTELKNINSFKFIEKAIDYEVARHIDCLESGQKIIQQTRLYDSTANKTFAMRSKEEANDYRYFPDPDLLPIAIDESFLEKIKHTLPELPQKKMKRFYSYYGLEESDIEFLLQDPNMCDYFEATAKQNKLLPKTIVNWLRGDISALLNRENKTIKDCPIRHDNFAKLLLRISDNTLSNKIAKNVLEQIWETQQDVDELIEQQELKQVDDSQLLIAIINQLVKDNPQLVEQFRHGKTKVLGFFVGQVMKQTKGKANPKQVNELLIQILQN